MNTNKFIIVWRHRKQITQEYISEFITCHRQYYFTSEIEKTPIVYTNKQEAELQLIHELQRAFYDDCDVAVIELTQEQLELLIERKKKNETTKQ